MKIDMFSILPEDPTPEIQTFVPCVSASSLQKNGYADGFAFPLKFPHSVRTKARIMQRYIARLSVGSC